MSEQTEGWLLGGRVRYAQPRHGFRTGIEPVVLAATIPAKPGARVLEGGTGAGAALLCLASRVAGIEGIGIEREPALAAIARANLAANDATALSVLTADVTEVSWHAEFDHAFANPPWRGASGTQPNDVMRTRATRGADLPRWITTLAATLRHGGTLTLILPASSTASALQALDAASCGGVRVLPLWPKEGREAKLLIVQAVRGGKGPLRLLAGMTLHRPDGGFTAAAQAILRDGGPLPLDASEKRDGAS